MVSFAEMTMTTQWLGKMSAWGLWGWIVYALVTLALIALIVMLGVMAARVLRRWNAPRWMYKVVMWVLLMAGCVVVGLWYWLGGGVW